MAADQATMKRMLQIVGGGVALLSYSYALTTLKPSSIPYITRATNHTFYTICEQIHNPSLHFKERVSTSVARFSVREPTVLTCSRKCTQ